jgi:hypothetical protein
MQACQRQQPHTWCGKAKNMPMAAKNISMQMSQF